MMGVEWPPVKEPCSQCQTRAPVCTVTWIRSSDGWELFANRDERRTRLPAQPPRVMRRRRRTDPGPGRRRRRGDVDRCERPRTRAVSAQRTFASRGGGHAGLHEPWAAGPRPPRVHHGRGGGRATGAPNSAACAGSSCSAWRSGRGRAPRVGRPVARAARSIPCSPWCPPRATRRKRGGTGSGRGGACTRGNRAHGRIARHLPPVPRAGGGTVVRVHAPGRGADREREPRAGDAGRAGGIPSTHPGHPAGPVGMRRSFSKAPAPVDHPQAEAKGGGVERRDDCARRPRSPTRNRSSAATANATTRRVRGACRRT